MEIGQIGEIGASVIVITVLELEYGTELDIVPTQHLLVMERKINDNKSCIKMEHRKIAHLINVPKFDLSCKLLIIINHDSFQSLRWCAA